MRVLAAVVVSSIMLSGIDLLYGDVPSEKKGPAAPPVFTVNAEYIHIHGGREDTSDAGAGDDTNGSGEWESDEYTIHASGNYTIDSLRFKNKAYHKRADYSVKGFPDTLISMGGDALITNGDYVFLGGVKYGADIYTRSMNAANVQVMGGCFFLQFRSPFCHIGNILYH